jgi:hypothetical protein
MLGVRSVVAPSADWLTPKIAPEAIVVAVRLSPGRAVESFTSPARVSSPLSSGISRAEVFADGQRAARRR